MDKTNAQSIDLEKSMEAAVISTEHKPLEKCSSSSESFIHSSVAVSSRLARWNTWIEGLDGFEARGIARVPPEERYESSILGYAKMVVLWFSMNATAVALALGFLGPLVLNLGFVDTVMTAVFGSLVGTLAVAYMSIWGAQSGHRTMIVARYFMGYWPAKLTCFLNILIMVGYSVIASIIAGQILSAVSGGSMSVVVGIIITSLISWLIALFGMPVFQTFERWAWIPQFVVLLILVGVARRNFDTSLKSGGGSTAVTAGRLTYFSLTLSGPVSWAAAASDYYVYYPETTSKRLAFLMTVIGLWASCIFVFTIGAGLASGVAATPSWSAAYDISSGALILEGYSAAGGFGKVCGVVAAFGVIQNNVPAAYSAALGCQVMGRYGKMVPRYIWVCVVSLVYFVCAIAGRNNLLEIFQNFLALMGYWLVMFVVIVLEEHLIFRRNRGFDWSAWENKKYLPVGVAALTAFLIGWAGAIIGMYQIWYIGPVAKLVCGVGADIGIWLGMGFTLLTFPPLRYLELRYLGR